MSHGLLKALLVAIKGVMGCGGGVGLGHHKRDNIMLDLGMSLFTDHAVFLIFFKRGGGSNPCSEKIQISKRHFNIKLT